MVGWYRHLQSILKQVGKRVEHRCSNAPPNRSTHLSKSPLIQGELPHLQGLWDLSSGNVSRPLCRYLLQMGFTSARTLLADSSDATPVPSPLTPVLAISSGQTEAQKAASKPSQVQAILKNIK